MSSQADPVRDIAHLGAVELMTPKLEESVWYFRDLLGMEVVHEAGPSVYLRGYGDYALAPLKLTAAGKPGVGCVAWRTVSEAALHRRVAALQAAGHDGEWTDGEFGRGSGFRFRDPDGHAMELYFQEDRYVAPPPLRSALKNQPMKYTGRGIGVRRIDHLALLAADVPKNRRFGQDFLGLQLREQVVFDNGATEIGSWLSTTAVHHEVAWVLDVRGAHGRLHHFSLWVDNREDVLRAADILTEAGIFVEAGPSKHNNSQAFYLYSYEPGGNRIEIYSGSFLIFAPDFEPVTWNEQERAGGVYWGGALPQSFLQYATPDVPAPPGPARTAEVPVFDPQ